MVHVAGVYSGYVSKCDWDRERPTALLLFMLADEAVAAAITLQLLAREAACRLHLGPQLEVRSGWGAAILKLSTVLRCQFTP